MSRIYTNAPAITALVGLQRNQDDLATRLQRLSTGLQINTGKDNPAGLIASEGLRSEITGIHQAVDNSTRAGNVLQTAEGGLNEISSLLLQLQSLTVQAANSGGLSPEEVKANQLQVDSILGTIDRISSTTEFGNLKLLNGQLDFITSGVNSSDIALAQIDAMKVTPSAPTTVAVQVTASALLARVGYTASGIGAAPTTIQLGGVLGQQQLTFAASAHNSAIADAINLVRDATGVSAVLSGGHLRLNSTDYGSKQFVSVRTLVGSFNAGLTAAVGYGADARVNINGVAASTDGLRATIRQGDVDLSLTLTPAFATQTVNSTSFAVTGGGALFQLGPTVTSMQQLQVGIGSVSTASLGNNIVGFLQTMGSGGANALVSGNTVAAQKVVSAAIDQVSTLRGRLGAVQKDQIESNINSLSIALENVTASESAIRDTDFAGETSAMTRAQILVQSSQSVLAQANAAPQSVLSLLGR